MSILIASEADDVHALSIKTAVLDQGFRDCFLIETDRISGHSAVSMRIGGRISDGQVRESGGQIVSLRDARVSWLRSLGPAQKFGPNPPTQPPVS
jgi:hypothetical protein